MSADSTPSEISGSLNSVVMLPKDRVPRVIVACATRRKRQATHPSSPAFVRALTHAKGTGKSTLRDRRVDFVRIEAEVRDRFGELLLIKLTGLGQRGERRVDRVLGVDLEVPPQRGPRITAAEPVCPQRNILTGHPGANLVGYEPHVVAHRDERAAHAFEHLLKVALTRLFFGMQPVPTLASAGVAEQLAIASDAPDVAADAELLRQHLLGAAR